MDEQHPWHRWFHLSWMDFFQGLPVTAEPEKDMSVKKQLLDVLLIRKEAATWDCLLPDGFEDLATYHLVTFKSRQEDGEPIAAAGAQRAAARVQQQCRAADRRHAALPHPLRGDEQPAAPAFTEVSKGGYHVGRAQGIRP